MPIRTPVREAADSLQGAVMGESREYWMGEQPRDGDRWVYAEFGTVLDDAATRQALVDMHGRYVKQWNDVELDPRGGLFKHTHEVHGAKVLAADGRFVLHGRGDSRSHWILEIVFSLGFREFHAFSFQRNTMRSPADMRSVHLHWCGHGRELFERWMDKERAATQGGTTSRSILARAIQMSKSRAADADAVRRHRWPASWAARWRSRG